jgi:hypothetical protein
MSYINILFIEWERALKCIRHVETALDRLSRTQHRRILLALVSGSSGGGGAKAPCW